MEENNREKAVSMLEQWGNYTVKHFNALLGSMYSAQGKRSDSYDFYEKYFLEGLDRMRTKYERSSSELSGDEIRYYGNMIDSFSNSYKKIRERREMLIEKKNNYKAMNCETYYYNGLIGRLLNIYKGMMVRSRKKLAGGDILLILFLLSFVIPHFTASHPALEALIEKGFLQKGRVLAFGA